MPDGPITKENILSALKYGKEHEDKRLPASWWVERVEKFKVVFLLTDRDEADIRREGAYLGKKGLDNLVAAIKSNYRSEAKHSSWQLSGKILDGQMPIALTLGSGYFSGITTEAVRSGINLGDLINRRFKLGGTINLPVKLYEENNRLMVDAELYNEKQILVCSIVRSEWQFNPDGMYDRNYNNNAFEIVDGNLMPVLQIYLKEPNKIYIGGFFRSDKGGSIGLTPKGILLNPLNPAGQVKEWVRLFKYPSRENPGKLEVENLPNFDMYDDEMALAEQIESNKFKYSQLTNERLKSKIATFNNDLIELYQAYQSQAERAMDKSRNEISTEALRHIMQAMRAAKSSEEREEAGRPLKENQERLIKRLEEIGQPIIKTYREQMRLDAILMRDEILRRLQRLPEREYRVFFLNIMYAGNTDASGIRNVIEDLQLLAAKLP